MTIRIKRVYEPQSRDDGTRVLVDRLWPRGLSKAEAAVHHWLKDIAPSSSLRKWFGHDPSKWDLFKVRYFEELEANPETVEWLGDLAKDATVTLLFGARDPEHNQAAALREYVLRQHGRAQVGSGRPERISKMRPPRIEDRRIPFRKPWCSRSGPVTAVHGSAFPESDPRDIRRSDLFPKHGASRLQPKAAAPRPNRN